MGLPRWIIKLRRDHAQHRAVDGEGGGGVAGGLEVGIAGVGVADEVGGRRGGQGVGVDDGG